MNIPAAAAGASAVIALCGQSHRLYMIAETDAIVPQHEHVLLGGLCFWFLFYLNHTPHAQPFLQAEVIQFTQRSRSSERTSVVHMGAEMSNKEMNS